MKAEIYKFGEFSLDSRQRVLFHAGKPLALTPKVFETLLYLVKNHGKLVEKGELLDAVWADSFVEEGNLTYNIRQLRKTLGDNAHHPRFIETIARRGYRFIADVEIAENPWAEIISKPIEIPTGDSSSANQNYTKAKTFSAKNLRWSLAIILLVLLIASGASVWQSQKHLQPRHLWASDETAASFSSVKFQKITALGQSTIAAISPDGKLIAYTNITGGKQSLWLRRLASDTSVRIVPTSEESFYGLQFSPDGEFIYFLKTGLNLFRIPVLGGVPTLILKDAGGFALSPDSKQIAFVKNISEHQCGIIIVDADGKNARTLVARQRPSCYKSATWLPDGKTIVAAAGQSDTGDSNTALIEISSETGAERQFGSMRWYHVNSAVWIPDKSGLILTGKERVTSEIQIWQVNYPGGDVRRLTNDGANYSQVSLTQDSSRLLTVQVSLNSHLEISSAVEPTKTRRLASAFHGLTWLSEDKIAYSSPTNGNSLWLINIDGSEQEQLTFNETANFNPSATPDGKYIVFVLANSERHHIWRMNADGSNRIQLTNMTGEQAPLISPDGKFVFYQLVGAASPPTIWRVSIDGGEPVQITKDYAIRPSVSPDGKLLAFFRYDEERKDRLAIVLMSLDEGKIIKTFLPEDNFSSLKIRWTKDGKNLAYATENSALTANIWLQPIDGSSPRQITDFTVERIFDFDWSPNEKWLGIIRGLWNHEVVLISRN